MNDASSTRSLSELFDKYRDSDGLLRDHGLTAMLLQSGMDRELTNRVIKRAQWLTEQYGSMCLTREDFELLMDEGARPEGYTGDRRGVKPMDPVRLDLGGVPTRGTAMLQAVRLGLDIENDVRVATDRINKLKLMSITPIVPLARIPDVPSPEREAETNSPSMIDLDESHGNDEPRDTLRGMPLL